MAILNIGDLVFLLRRWFLFQICIRLLFTLGLNFKLSLLSSFRPGLLLGSLPSISCSSLLSGLLNLFFNRFSLVIILIIFRVDLGEQIASFRSVGFERWVRISCCGIQAILILFRGNYLSFWHHFRL